MFEKSIYDSVYHDKSLTEYKFLVTGGAGFIGSNLVEYLLKNKAGLVRVLDNLSTGFIKNIERFEGLENFEFIEGDIRNMNDCISVVENIDFISHQAALGSVPRSIFDPITTNEVNISGFLNMLNAAKNSKKVKRFVYAASSSTYGDSTKLPKIEGTEGKPLSPYAVTKLVNELYAHVYGLTYNFQSIGLRYFNIFGPNQNPEGEYAAVIPYFIKHIMNNKSPVIHGDGLQTRDFTFVENAIQANIKAMLVDNESSVNQIYNIACGDRISILDMFYELNQISNNKVTPLFKAQRIGDVRDSLADISKAQILLKYNPKVKFKQGLEFTYKWFSECHKS